MNEQIDAMSSDDFSKMILENLKLSVQKLEEPGNRKEADFLANYEDETFLIEAKLKEDDKKELAKRERDLSQGNVYVKEDVQGRDNTISGALSNARSQLIASAKFHKHDLRLVMHISKGINAKAKSEKATDTLLGRTQIFNGRDNTLKPCYFFRYSDFFTHRYAFDAAIVGYLDANYNLNIYIYINPHSPRYEKAKESAFLTKMGRIDPKAEEAQGKAYIPNADVSVKNSLEMEMHLHIKYDNKMLIPFDFKTPELAIRSKQSEQRASN